MSVISAITAGALLYSATFSSDFLGEFNVPITVNGVQMEAAFDTGATGVTLPEDLAKQAGVRFTSSVRMRTAIGVVPARLFIIDNVKVGPCVLHSVPGVTVPAGTTPLLGMSALRHLDVHIVNDQLTLTCRDTRAG
jgi:aspartyl protease family protein